MGHLQPLHLPKARACLLVLPTVEMGRQAAILALWEVTPTPATGHKGFSLPSLSVALSGPISASMFLHHLPISPASILPCVHPLVSPQAGEA